MARYSTAKKSKAFEICTGKSAYRNEGKYIGFLNGLFGVSLKRAFTPTPRDLFSLGYRTKAIKLYRELNDCTLLEAKAVVDKWELQPSN